MAKKQYRSDTKKNTIEESESLTFPGRKTLLENIMRVLDVQGDVWIHHGYNVPTEDPFVIQETNDIDYQDNVIVPSVLHTLIDKVGAKKTTSISAITGMKKPELILILDPAIMNLAVIFKERLWITEILLKEAPFLFPSPFERTNALVNILKEMSQPEVSPEDISIEITSFRTDRGVQREDILIPLDSDYKPVLGGKDPSSKLKNPVSRLPDGAELVMMICDAISSSARMYMGTVNVRLDEDREAMEYPKNVHVACLKIYKRYIDVMEIRAMSQLHQTDYQNTNFRIYRTEISRPLRRLFQTLHL
jgi:hypothetical protein